ncbi:hypothetical protein N7536_009070 [Penicillium majusculum]|nr:hypothetical protein N7536_009070 [Penicillium majusculum]
MTEHQWGMIKMNLTISGKKSAVKPFFHLLNIANGQIICIWPEQANRRATTQATSPIGGNRAKILKNVGESLNVRV